MGKKRFNKKNAQTFSVVHRSHEDSLYYDNDASKHVLVPAAQKHSDRSGNQESRQPKVVNTQQLAEKLGSETVGKIRDNEGLAAQYGIFFDDSNYDYMQHLRPIGHSDGVFIEAKSTEKKNKNKLEDIIKDVMPSETKRKVAIDDTENIPVELQGFNPDMDARLREVMGALEDDAYVAEGDGSGEDEDLAALLQSGEVDDDEFYYGSDAEGDADYDEWDLDNYQDEYDAQYALDQYEELEDPYNEGELPADLALAAEGNVVSNAWMKDFMKFKREERQRPNTWDSDDDFASDVADEGANDEENEGADVVGELPLIQSKGRGKGKSKNKMRKKKGAMSDTSSFSMSSSALFRTEGLTLLDDRFEQMNRKYEQDDGDADEGYRAFDMSSERPDLEGMLDDFLDNYELEKGGRRLVKKDEENDHWKRAADSASNTKLAARRKKAASKKSALGSLGLSFGNLSLGS